MDNTVRIEIPKKEAAGLTFGSKATFTGAGTIQAIETYDICCSAVGDKDEKKEEPKVSLRIKLDSISVTQEKASAKKTFMDGMEKINKKG